MPRRRAVWIWFTSNYKSLSGTPTASLKPSWGAIASEGKPLARSDYTMLRLNAHPLFLTIARTDHVLSESPVVTIDAVQIRPTEKCPPAEDKLTHEDQALQAFEHPEESVIDDLAALSLRRHRCSSGSSRRIPLAVGSSSGARELLTRFDTGQRRNKSSRAGPLR